FEKVMIEQKTKVGDKLIKAAKGVIKDLFNITCLSDDEDVIMRDFKKYADSMKHDLDRIEDKYSVEPRYPGKDIIKKGKSLLSDLLLITFPTEFFNAVKANEDDLLNFGEDIEPVKKFFAGDQKNIFDQCLDILRIYAESKTYIVDGETESAAKGIRDIISMSSPYTSIHKLPGLREKFMTAYGDLLEKQAVPIMAAVESARDRVFEELDGKKCRDKLKDRYIARFDELRTKVQHCNNVAVLQGISVEADAMKMRCLNEIDAEEAKLTTPVSPVDNGGDTPEPQKKNKKMVSIKTINTSNTWQIETEADVKKYVSELENRLMAQLEDNTIINIVF
nr:BREX system P-loop protein BrxC [Oscillospiraceae bacterium]